MRTPYFTRLAQAVENEIATTARVIAQRLPFADDSPDAEKMSRREYIELVQQRSEEPDFLQQLLDRMAPADPSGTRPVNGLRYYLALIKAARPDLYQQGTGETPSNVLQMPGTLTDDDIRDALGLNEMPEPPYDEPMQDDMMDDEPPTEEVY